MPKILGFLEAEYFDEATILDIAPDDLRVRSPLPAFQFAAF
jgi:hypothetical protein